MTTDREVMLLALDAMVSFSTGTNGLYEGEFAEEIAALRAALARGEQKPVAWVDLDCWLHGEFWPDDCFSDEAQEGYTPLYTTPPQREWQSLTDEECKAVGQIFENDNGHVQSWLSFARAIEARMKEKNT